VHGYRFQAFATDTPVGQLGHLEARHRAHARVEDRIRCAKDTGLGRFPSRQININAAWLELSLLASDLIAWTQTILLDGDLARCEPKTLRYRLLHVPARITRGQRRRWLRIASHWPWRHELAAAFTRLPPSGARCAPDRPRRPPPPTTRGPASNRHPSRPDGAAHRRTQIPPKRPTNIHDHRLCGLLKDRG
jgi:Transposase DDE domain group 1